MERILGEAELAEVDGPFVKLSLRGRFWHTRAMVLARLGNYLKSRIPVSCCFSCNDKWIPRTSCHFCFSVCICVMFRGTTDSFFAVLWTAIPTPAQLKMVSPLPIENGFPWSWGKIVQFSFLLPFRKALNQTVKRWQEWKIRCFLCDCCTSVSLVLKWQ